MASALRRAIAGITREEAARILAVHEGTVDRLIRRGVLAPGRKYATAQLSREQVEQLALTTRPVRQLVAGDYLADPFRRGNGAWRVRQTSATAQRG